MKKEFNAQTKNDMKEMWDSFFLFGIPFNVFPSSYSFENNLKAKKKLNKQIQALKKIIV